MAQLAGIPRRRSYRVTAGFAVVAAMGLIVSACSSSGSSSQPPGGSQSSGAATGTGSPFTGPTTTLKPFDPNIPAGAKPSNLPQVVAFANQSDAGFFLDFQNGVKSAVTAQGWQFLSANAAGDASKNLTQVNTFLQRGIGFLLTAPVGANLGPAQTSALNKGIGVFSFLSGPALSVASADQYNIGYTQGKDAADFIKANMNGQANVVYINANELSPVLIPRDKGAIAGLQSGGAGVKVVADQFNTPGVDTGNKLMSQILQAHPDVNVVLGDDESVLGALSAFRTAGKLSQLKYMSGVNGSKDALAVIAAGDTPYKTDYSFGYGPLGYTWGQMAIDYSQGKSIPMVVDVNPIALSSKSDIDKFEQDTSNPAGADLTKYLKLLGNISYATRGEYVNYSP